MVLLSLLKAFSFLRAMVSPGTLRGEVGDGRERDLLQHVVDKAEQGKPQSVLDCIDQYVAANGTWFMNIGDAKGPILDAAVKEARPKVALELGTYCGYSAVRIAWQMEQPGSVLVSIEINGNAVKIAREMVNHSGLSSKVKVLEGTLKSCMEEVKQILKELKQDKFDLVFIDHDKNLYLSDYLLLKEQGLLASGTVVVGDNMGFPSSPAFLKYLRNHTDELRTVEHKCKLEYLGWISDMVTVSTVI